MSRRSAARVLVVHCHPLAASFTAAARDRVLAGLTRAGRSVRVRDLYEERWDTDGDLAAHLQDLDWCDAVVLVYPTWWSGQPAMLNDWIVRCWPDEVRRPHIRRLAAVSSHGSPRHINALEGEIGKHLLTRWIGRRCRPLTRLDWIPLYTIDTCTDLDRQAFLDRLEEHFASDY